MIPPSDEPLDTDASRSTRPAFSLRSRHTRTLRDAAEVAAILIAGVWALYVFVYENRIVPALEPPTPSIAIEMRHVGNDGNLAVVRLDETIHNPGPTEVHFLGYAVTVFGSRVVPSASMQAAKTGIGQNDLEAYNTYTTGVPIFREAFVSAQGNAKSTRGFDIEPTQTTAFSKEFYVPRNRFDRLEAWVGAVYVKSLDSIPTTLVIRPSGLAAFETPPGISTYRVAAPFAALDLKAE
jgi:hypothetical protein